LTDSERSQGRRELPLTVLRHRDYRLIWAGEAISGVGTQMHAIALSWQVFEITGSVALLGLLGLVRAISLMTVSMAGGAIADSVDRRRLLIVTNLILLVLSAGLALATRADAVSVPLLFIVAALVAAVSSFDGPARQSLIPTLVPRGRIPDAMSVNILTGNVADMFGPALGGFAIALIGISGAYAIDAVSFLAVVVALMMMEQRDSARVRISRGSVAMVAEGLRFVKRTPVIYGVMLLDFLATILGATIALTPVFADIIFDAGPQGLGLLNSAPAIGAVCGAAVMSVIRQPQRPGRIILLAIASYGLFLILFGLSPNIWIALIFLAGYGASDAVSMTMRHTIRNLATPDDLRGRVAATHSTFSSGGPRLGEFQTGLMASLIGIRATPVIGGIGCIIVAIGVAKLIPAVLRYEFSETPADAPDDKGLESELDDDAVEIRSS
jgi:MFS family permease